MCNCKCGLMSGFGRVYCTSASCGSMSCPSMVSTRLQTTTDHYYSLDSDPSHFSRFPSALAARAEQPLNVAIPWHHLCEPDLLRKPLADRNRTWRHSNCVITFGLPLRWIKHSRLYSLTRMGDNSLSRGISRTTIYECSLLKFSSTATDLSNSAALCASWSNHGY